MKYTKTFRDSILRKVLPPENRSVSSVSKEMEVAVVTINSWLAKLKMVPSGLEKKLKAAEKEILRKNDALAEMAALIMLKKKLDSKYHGITDEDVK